MITKTDDLLKLIRCGQLDKYDVRKLKKELKEDKRNGRKNRNTSK